MRIFAGSNAVALSTRSLLLMCNDELGLLILKFSVALKTRIETQVIGMVFSVLALHLNVSPFKGSFEKSTA